MKKLAFAALSLSLLTSPMVFVSSAMAAPVPGNDTCENRDNVKTGNCDYSHNTTPSWCQSGKDWKCYKCTKDDPKKPGHPGGGTWGKVDDKDCPKVEPKTMSSM